MALDIWPWNYFAPFSSSLPLLPRGKHWKVSGEKQPVKVWEVFSEMKLIKGYAKRSLILKHIWLTQVTQMGRKTLHLKICLISFVEKHYLTTEKKLNTKHFTSNNA